MKNHKKIIELQAKKDHYFVILDYVNASKVVDKIIELNNLQVGDLVIYDLTFDKIYEGVFEVEGFISKNECKFKDWTRKFMPNEHTICDLIKIDEDYLDELKAESLLKFTKFWKQVKHKFPNYNPNVIVDNDIEMFEDLDALGF